GATPLRSAPSLRQGQKKHCPCRNSGCSLSRAPLDGFRIETRGRTTDEERPHMTTTNEAPTLSLSLTYRNLRLLFAAGLVLQIALLFVPAYRATVRGFSGFGGEARSLSGLDVVRLQFRAGQTGWGLFSAATYSAFALLLVLAFSKPSGWVFLSGASLVTFLFVLEFF